MELDHVLIVVADLDAAAAEFERRYGLASIAGGRHPGWGTANRIVPLGDSYLELIAVVDHDEAGASAFGSWVVKRPAGDGLLGWAVRTGDLDGVSARLGLEIQPGSRTRPDGTELRWRAAGVECALADPCLPFFIEWGDGVALPGRVAEPAGTIERLDLEGDPLRLSSWLGEQSLPISIERGEPAVRRVVLGVRGRSVAIGG